MNEKALILERSIQNDLQAISDIFYEEQIGQFLNFLKTLQ